MKDLIYIPEPRLLFRHGQAMEDPRDGLTLNKGGRNRNGDRHQVL
jgi:hypothetical protein